MLKVVCYGTSFEKSLMRNDGVCQMGGRPDANSNLQVKGRKTTLHCNVIFFPPTVHSELGLQG